MYVPDGNPEITKTPKLFVAKVAVTGTPFLKYLTVYVVVAANPESVMLPVDELHAVGLVDEEEVIFGVGFTKTVVVPGKEGQLPVVAVAITE